MMGPGRQTIAAKGLTVRRALVTLVNPNKVHPPVTPYALDILTSSLELTALMLR